MGKKSTYKTPDFLKLVKRWSMRDTAKDRRTGDPTGKWGPRFLIETLTNIPGSKNVFAAVTFRPYAVLMAAAPAMLKELREIARPVEAIDNKDGEPSYQELRDYYEDSQERARRMVAKIEKAAK